jgi:hypothetical protein
MGGPKPAPKRTRQPFADTTMSDPHLPAEILDHIVDHLHDTEDALRNCCLVSKSWVPRTRKHLFAEVDFFTVAVLQSWKETFPDPSISPAHYTRSLFVDCPEDVAGVDAEAGGWIRGFSRVVHLEVASPIDFFSEFMISLIPFCGLSPALKSLCVTASTLPSSHIFDLILSFPLLEDLALAVGSPLEENSDDPEGVERPTTTQPSSSPVFTGSLVLDLRGGMKSFACRLLSLPSGIHFRGLTLTWRHEGDLSMIMGLVEECSHTLESLDIERFLQGMSTRNLRAHR